MRFFKTTDVNKLLKQIAAEMVNITYGETYFDKDGNLLEKKLPNHNVYNIDTVEYSIVPNYGNVHILGDSVLFNSLVNNIETKFHEMCRIASTKFGMLTIPVASNGTTQYMCVTQPNIVNCTSGNMKFTINARPDTIPSGFHFLWNITSDNIPISFYTKNAPSALYSLSSIVVETGGQIDLPDGFKGPDYPSYKDYKISASGRLRVEPMDFHPNYGVHRELTKYFPDAAKSKKKLIFAKCSRPIKLVNWDWIKPYSISSESSFDWAEQIRMGLLDTEPSEEVMHTCVATNVPIYDDCYVFDITERMIEEIIEEKDLLKYTNAVIVEDEPSAPVEDEKKSSKKPKPKKSKKKSNQESDSENSNSDRENAEDDEDDDDDEDEILRPKRKSKAKSKAKAKAKAKAAPVKASAKAPVKVAPKIIKRGAKEPTKMIKIKYAKEYDTPKCVLISPYYMHLFGHLDAVTEFEKATKTKVLVYRTKSPRNILEVIESSSADALTKKLLIQLYQGAYFKDYRTIATADKNVSLTYSNGGSSGYSNSLLVSDTSIVGHLVSEIRN